MTGDKFDILSRSKRTCAGPEETRKQAQAGPEDLSFPQVITRALIELQSEGVYSNIFTLIQHL
jgi:hypothetical protein